MITEHIFECPFDYCGFSLPIEVNINGCILPKIYEDIWLHYILHSENWIEYDCMVGSHDFIEYFSDNVPEEAFGVIDRTPYFSEENPRWIRACYDGLSKYLDKKMGYVRIEDMISDEEKELINWDVENKLFYRNHRLTDKFFEKYEGCILPEGIEITEMQKELKLRNNERKLHPKKEKSYNKISFDEKREYLKKLDGISEREFSIPKENLSQIDIYLIEKTYEYYKKINEDST